MIVAAACEIPVGCPNRVERGALAHRAAEYLTSGQNGLTPSAAAALASATRGSHAGSLRELLLSGELTLLESRVAHPIRGGGAGRAAAVEEPPPAVVEPVVTEEVRTWIKFKVVEDRTDRPIPDVVLRILLPNGNEQDYTTRADGLVEIADIDQGTCTVSCHPARPRLKNTYQFVATGEPSASALPAPSNSERPVDSDAGQEPPATEEMLGDSDPVGKDEPEFASDGRILFVEEHKVQTGETIKSLAEANGMTWQELAEFNWDTSVPDEINQHLRDELGCTKRTADGNNYVFDGNDTPGILLIPRPWTRAGFATERTHVIRVRRMRVVFDYGFERFGDHIHLSFSVKGDQPPVMKVRLYEYNREVPARRREEMIRGHAAEQREKPGYEKSGCYHEVQAGETLQSIAESHGLRGASEIYDHYENTELRAGCPSASQVEAGEMAYVPQLRGRKPIPLGELLDVEEVDEPVDGGKRYEARWSIDRSGYDPLDHNRWLPERQVGIPTMRNLTFDPDDDEASEFILPQFAVLTGDYQVLGVSPTPLWLVRQTEYQGTEESERLLAFMTDGTLREMGATHGTELFDVADEPVVFFGAEDFSRPGSEEE